MMFKVLHPLLNTELLVYWKIYWLTAQPVLSLEYYCSQVSLDQDRAEQKHGRSSWDLSTVILIHIPGTCIFMF